MSEFSLNSRNLSFDSTTVAFYKFSTEVLTICQLIALPFMLYLIFTHSNKMQTYRFYILNNIFWNSVVEITKCLICPLFHTPSSSFIFIGPITPFSDPSMLFTLLELLLFCAANYSVSVSITMAYRVVMLLDIKWLIPLYDNKKSFLVAILLIFGASVGLVGSMFETKRNGVLESTKNTSNGDFEERRYKMISKCDFLNLLFP